MRDNKLETLQIRLPREILKLIDKDAKRSLYSTRSEFIRNIMIRYYEMESIQDEYRNLRKRR